MYVLNSCDVIIGNQNSLVYVSLSLSFLSDTSPVSLLTAEYQPLDGLITNPPAIATSNRPDHLLIPPSNVTSTGILDFSRTNLDFSTLTMKLYPITSVPSFYC